MNISDLIPYAPLIPLVTAPIYIATAVAAWSAVHMNIKINRRNKRADTIIHCNNRYDELYKFKVEVLKSPDAKLVTAYYSRYWGLKSDEFDYWLARLVDVETFTNWLYLTMQAFEDKRVVGTGAAEMDFVRGWLEVGIVDNEATNPWFVDLVSALKKIADSNVIGKYGQTKFTVLLEVVELAEWKSKKYRKALQGDMSMREYRMTLNDAKLNQLRLSDIVKT